MLLIVCCKASPDRKELMSPNAGAVGAGAAVTAGSGPAGAAAASRVDGAGTVVTGSAVSGCGMAATTAGADVLDDAAGVGVGLGFLEGWGIAIE